MLVGVVRKGVCLAGVATAVDGPVGLRRGREHVVEEEAQEHRNVEPLERALVELEHGSCPLLWGGEVGKEHDEEVASRHPALPQIVHAACHCVECQQRLLQPWISGDINQGNQGRLGRPRVVDEAEEGGQERGAALSEHSDALSRPSQALHRLCCREPQVCPGAAHMAQGDTQEGLEAQWRAAHHIRLGGTVQTLGKLGRQATKVQLYL
jgi:hypothetical protein